MNSRLELNADIVQLYKPVLRFGLKAAGREAQQTFAIDEALEVLDACEYSVTEPDIFGWFERGLCFASGPGGTYTRDNLLQLCIACELRLMWKPKSTLHEHKKSKTRKTIEQNPYHCEEVVQAMCQYDSRFLLVMAREADDPNERDALLELLLARVTTSDVILDSELADGR